MDNLSTSRQSLTFNKNERLCRKILIDRLFAGGSKSILAFPIRMVYLPVEKESTPEPVSILISVPKKRFRRAVKRNRVKRQIREAYRHNKSILVNKIEENNGNHLIIGFIWLDDKLHESTEINSKMNNLLTRLNERL